MLQEAEKEVPGRTFSWGKRGDDLTAVAAAAAATARTMRTVSAGEAGGKEQQIRLTMGREKVPVRL